MSEISMRPAEFADRENVYNWLARSDATVEMMGPPTFPDHPVPGFAGFCADYDEEAFAPEGCFRIFVIRIDGEDAGVIQYWRQEQAAELDIWIGDRRHWGSGIGSGVLKQAARMLRDEGVETLVIRPSARNERAVAAYRKAGFEDYDPAVHNLPRKFVEEGRDYEDAVTLAWRL
ncbi:MAG: GNAT family protein [Rhodobacteraceae bacterium]|nr:GNAT family protein [Paracoccaceae bacterium]